MYRFKLFTTALVLLLTMQFVYSDEATKPGFPGAEAPDFTIETNNGKKLTLSKLRGKRGAVLVFFATWCPSCMAEVPEVIKFAEEARKHNVLVYGVNLQQPKRIVDKFVNDSKVNYRILMDIEGKVGRSYSVTGIPLIVGIDANGIVKYREHGLPHNSEMLIKTLQEGIKATDKPVAKGKQDYVKDGISFISKETLQNLMNSQKKPVIIDVLGTERYAKSHVQGAINIPLAELKEKAATLDKNKTTVVYCANYKCHASTKAAQILMELGFKDVHDYKGGIKEWKEAGLPTGSK